MSCLSSSVNFLKGLIMFITNTHINSGVDVFTCDMVGDVEALKGIRYGKVIIDISKFPLVNRAFSPNDIGEHKDYLLSRLGGEASSLLWREVAKNQGWSTNEELNAFFDEVDIVRDLTRVAQQGHNEIIFKKD